MKTLTVELKQHTPLIHFQHDQQGATLRASEVKPKLDRFILTKLGNGNYQDGIDAAKNNGWLVGKGEHPAIDYKMRIEATDNSENDIYLNSKEPKFKNGKVYHILEDFPMLLSNMGGKENEEELVNFSFHRKIELVITVIIKDKIRETELYEKLKEHITEFFANNNFGQRSSKGFGSFTATNINNEDIAWKHGDVYESETRLMRYIDTSDEIDYDTISKLFAVIDFYWKCLKSGVNYTKRIINRHGDLERKNGDRYIKAYLWTYLNSLGKTWEKRQVKNDLDLECERPSGETTAPNNNPVFFARAHLGCPMDGITYKIPRRDGVNRETSDRIDIKISHSNTDIERIPAPITFKPVFHTIQNGAVQVVSVYILINQEQADALYNAHDTNFVFTNTTNGNTTTVPLYNNQDGTRFNIDFKDLISKYHTHLKAEMPPKGQNYIFPFDFRGDSILDENIKVEFNRTPQKP